ncbi:Rieske (2Fe-2S) iron-sulfur domain protein [Arcobacter nitrofigilis DSM 7299]|uniref:Rieske (2Fe-2S) iron-sulfur domain protein n=1 Tax=Arcobacter nitrofigilis (strain ATCC 33309 / DSM 7299 / CCUG 15893 / LMG 7604 / NCTC 12251 / CI) TaxID=572480 RepID=D5V5M5_ARCNC|nr:nitrite reductase small subunit NirD [Arcobacter nitrofigilis]ADG92061.1 Rieske (2Fe-2S) iron-sulfur domain protein [Arcobacter nitrofigilis DSM 7299]
MKTWIQALKIDEVPIMGSRVLYYKEEEIAIFKTKDGEIHAINNICPHKKGKLSEGLVHESMVTCPLHNWDIDLKNGEAKGENCNYSTIYETQLKDNYIYLKI